MQKVENYKKKLWMGIRLLHARRFKEHLMIFKIKNINILENIIAKPFSSIFHIYILWHN